MKMGLSADLSDGVGIHVLFRHQGHLLIEP